MTNTSSGANGDFLFFVLFFYPVVGADASKAGPFAGAEVEGRHREAAAVQTHHVGAAGRSVLHVAQVGPVLQQGVAPPDGDTQASQN